MKLRWVTKKNHVTADEVRKYCEKNHTRQLKSAKEILENEEGPTLQYFDEVTGDWEEVEEVLEYRGYSKNNC